MNREILFRGKRKDNGEWVYGWYAPLVCNDKTVIPSIKDSNGSDWRVEPETIGQFTGVYDKNGDEIYEGDILEFDGAEIPEEERAVVIFADGKFKLKNPKYDYMDDLDSLTASMEIIVGNTYDGIYGEGQGMEAVLISIQPKWVEKIASGEKTIEVRKTAPKQVPFKCYIYCTFPKKPAYTLWLNRRTKNKFLADGKVIGEFICDKVFLLHPYTYDRGSADLGHRKFIQTFDGSKKGNEILDATCLTQDEMFDYIGVGNYGYGWHISDLKIYDKPKVLEEFKGLCRTKVDCFDCPHYNYNKMGCNRQITRAPQSWQYVEELN